MLTRQKTFAKNALKKNQNPIEQALNSELATIKGEGAEKIQEKMLEVNKPEYLLRKQETLNEAALMAGERPKKAKIGEYEYLDVMNEGELNMVLLALLPIIKLEEKPGPDKCKYLLGT